MIQRYFLLLILLLSSLTGCGLFGGDSDEPPASTATLVISADPMVNLNADGEPASVEIQVVFLKEDSIMDRLYYEEVANATLKKLLGTSYIDHQDYSLKPNQLKTVKKIKFKEGTNYLGVIAHLANPEETEWYKIVPIDDAGKKYTILVSINSDGVNIQKDEKD